MNHENAERVVDKIINDMGFDLDYFIDCDTLDDIRQKWIGWVMYADKQAPSDHGKTAS